MDQTVWVAIAGIGGTLLAAVLSPLLSEFVRRGSTRRGQLFNRAIDAYADLLTVAAVLAANAETWEMNPTAQLRETDREEMDRLIGRVRVVAGTAVRSELDKWWSAVGRFYSLLGDAHGYYQTLPDEPGTRMADPGAIEMRSMLHNQASKLGEAIDRLEAAIRRELRR